ncbi:4Fe-4S binding protein [Candidatus Bipolaricaulota bacterium]
MLRRSTRKFWRMGREVEGYSFSEFIHGYVYTRWPYAYIGIAKGVRKIPVFLQPLVGAFAWYLLRSAMGRNPHAKQEFANRYHGKVVPTEAAEQLVTLDHPIELHDLETIIPYDRAKEIVLSDPDHLVALECPCRSEMENPCLPLDVCLIVGEPFTSFVVDHHPNHSRWISQDEAVDILRAEHDRGHVHHAFFKDAMLGRFYAICNCCSCCCGAMQATRNGTPMLASSGFVVARTSETCVGCGLCVKVCPFEALEVQDDLVRINDEKCMGCGVCVSKCPHEVLSLVRCPDRGEPLILSELLSSVRSPN